MKYIESFLRGYSGNKCKIGNQIIPRFPNSCNTFVDMFTGSGFINYNYLGAKKYICVEIQEPILNLHKEFKIKPLGEIIKFLEKVDNETLNDKLEHDFEKLKNIYNETRNPLVLILIARQAFSSLLSFNSEGLCNVSESITRRKMKKLSGDLIQDMFLIKERIENQDRIYICDSFENFPVEKLTSDDFVYIDPPYFQSCANYNKLWDDEKYKKLIKMMEYFDSKNIGFGYSDMLIQNDIVNVILKDFASKSKTKIYKIENKNYDKHINNKINVRKNLQNLEIYLTNRF